jgi:hypothetical protein
MLVANIITVLYNIRNEKGSKEFHKNYAESDQNSYNGPLIIYAQNNAFCSLSQPLNQE